MSSIQTVLTDALAALPGQARRLAVVAPVVASLTALILLAAALQRFVPVQFLVRDPSQTAKYPFYIGLISYIGIMGWATAAAIALFAAALTTDRAARYVLLTGGSLSAVLGVDDLLILHESALPDYLGVPERSVLIAYGVLAALFVLGGARYLLRATDYLLLVLAFLFFAASEVFDLGFLNQGLNYLLDDGLKLFGIVFWATYLVRTASGALRAPATAPAIALEQPFATASADR